MRGLSLAISLFLILTSSSSALDSNGIGSTTTVAGDGYAGIVDGTGEQARFMSPSGLAVDHRTKSIYVADSAAQRIRKIDRFGIVTTVAGSGRISRTGLDVRGGYADGPVYLAKFNNPTGLAIGMNGDLFVADSFNHCIRKISGGMVSTIAGRPDSNEGRDGSINDATFIEPRSISIDTDGTLYVADKGKGIRVVTAMSVTTFAGAVPIDIDYAQIYGNEHKYLFYLAPGYVGRFDMQNSSGKSISGSSAFGGMEGFSSLTVINSDLIVISAVLYDSIYSASFDCTNSSGNCLENIAGNDDEDPTQAGGFEDGRFTKSLFYNPTGIAQLDERDIVVSDSSNRRIRKLHFDRNILDVFSSSFLRSN